jgi:hypothetical protein
MYIFQWEESSKTVYEKVVENTDIVQYMLNTVIQMKKITINGFSIPLKTLIPYSDSILTINLVSI